MDSLIPRCLALGLALAAITSFATAAPGDLDAGFGANGIARFHFDPAADDDAYDVALDNGQILIVGAAGFGTGFWVARLTPAGNLDPTFGTGGIVAHVIGAPTYNGGTGRAIAIQGSKIVVAARITSGTPLDDMAVARLLTDGSLDTTFGTDGATVIANLVGSKNPTDVVVQADGKIVVLYHEDNFEAKVARINADGGLDAGFGTGGLVSLAIGGAVSGRMALQADGKIVGAYRMADDFVVFRLTTAGVLDPSFGTGGQATVDAGASERGAALALQPDGRVLVGGRTFGTGFNDFVIVRLLDDGSLDGSFGTGGTTTADFAGLSDLVIDIAVAGDGRIVAFGNASDIGIPAENAIARFLADGSLDPSFGIGGQVTTPVDAAAVPRAMILQPDGKILGVGRREVSGGPRGTYVVRYESVDTVFTDGFESGNTSAWSGVSP